MPVAGFDPMLMTASELQKLLEARILRSVEIVDTYLAQIEAHNRRGRQLRALISVAPKHHLLAIAQYLDNERNEGRIRGPLHGIPIVVKDNIMTDPRLGMDTTVGSYAFVGGRPKKNATVVERLIRKGMIIIGKANLTEFCGLKTPQMPPGWSAVGGQCQSPYVSRHIAKGKLKWELSAPGGSSTGSAVSVAAGFSTLAVGTDTIGSLITPANRASLYAMKPTPGKVPMDGIFSLSGTFDSPGGMAKSATDLVNLMNTLVAPTECEVGSPAAGTCYKIKEGWEGLHIGFAAPSIWKMWLKSKRINADAERYMRQRYESIIATLHEVHASLSYPIELPLPGSLSLDGRNSFEPIVYHEFKARLNDFLASFTTTKVHSLAEIINFNLEHPELTLPPSSPNQDDLHAALESTLTQADLAQARANLKSLGGAAALDKLFSSLAVDIIAAPGDSALCSLAAAAGYPMAVVPLGALKLNGQPFGIALCARAHEEAKLVHFMTAYESTFPGRPLPLQLDSVPMLRDDKEMLPDKPIVDLILHEWDTRRFNCSADALADWLNRRWRKSGYMLSPETVCEVLRGNGRVAFRGLGDQEEGAFAR
ncbi:amidase signature enzyme [Pseudovirgaria hyperparasitica]|uniref:Amidase signature enzyme n=1 Tax=Pseudovirgaria hyperparasitica TaxID=470096 RepID=A0A6A6WMJ2_9PEZI|nr:amidase signature enzyme [Pseudovirgaria hyperparasitica]KAF2763447.1 amidase signature enzyme [Pseudovirgaria hyperparasitica]